MTEVMRSVDNYPEAVFIDIGANIGSDLNSISILSFYLLGMFTVIFMAVLIIGLKQDAHYRAMAAAFQHAEYIQARTEDQE